MTILVGKKVYSLVLVAVVVFSLSLISSFQNIRELDEEFDSRIRNSMWVLSQVESEYLRFIHTLESFGNGSGDVTHDDVILRMDIFWSRLPLLIHGKDSVILQKIDGVLETGQNSIAMLERLEPLVRNLRVGDTATLTKLQQEFSSLSASIHDVLLGTTIISSKNLGLKDQRVESALQRGLISFIGVIVFGGSLVFMQFSEVNKRRTLEEVLRGLATVDSLTGTNNRRHYLELSEMELHRIRRHKRPLSALMMDLDNFKNINDTYGHAVGDEVLKRFVEICSGHLRLEDIMGRMGGEEFAVTLPEESAETALITAERLRNSFEKQFINVEGGSIKVTVSIGIAELKDTDETFEDCLYRADSALYVAKNAGRNRVEMA